jgi:parallel beta-helix repeat protein
VSAKRRKMRNVAAAGVAMYALAVAAGVLAARRGRPAGAGPSPDDLPRGAPPGGVPVSSAAHDGEAQPERCSRRRISPHLVVAAALCALALGLGVAAPSGASSGTADEIHYTYTGSTSVTFDWRGTATDIQYGATSSYGTTVAAQAPSPMPFSSSGPFEEADLTGLQAGTTYHYSIGGGPDGTFSTDPTGDFRFDVEADVGSSDAYPNVAVTQAQIAADSPKFVLVVGDLAYGNVNGQGAVDQHFNDVMAWSRSAAYMPAWGNHEWETPSADDLRNYKGRFALPNAQGATGSPTAGCCGEDWSWFDAGGVRFISYPEPYTSATWRDWSARADSVMAAAQADPSVNYIVTFGHRPAYSTGLHPGDTTLANILDALGDKYPKYVLNLNGHSHDYERFQPIHRITHITTGGGGSTLEPPWTSTDPRTAYRAMHIEHLRVDVNSTGMRIDAICGPPTSADDVTCAQGSVMDSYTIGTPPPLPPANGTIYVAGTNPSCSDTGAGTSAAPLCTISAAAARTSPGTTVVVSAGTYNEQVTVRSGSAGSPVTFTAAPGAKVTVTGGKYGFYVSNKSYVTIEGFNVTKSTSDGFHVSSNSSNIKLVGNTVSFAGQPTSGGTAKGIYVANSTGSVFSFNKVHDNSSYGIYLDSASGCQVLDNEAWANAQVYQRAASGIRLYGSTQNVVASNLTHDNEDSGIEIYTGSNNNLVTDNVTYRNGDHGIDNYSSTGNRLIANSAYRNVTAGINAEGGSTGTTIANNISVDNGINSPRTRSDIRVDQASVAGTTMDYDLVHLTTPDVILIWNSVSYRSLAAFQSATGQEMHGVDGDPQWKSPAGGDFHLTAASAAIDSANSSVSGQPLNDADGSPRVDDLEVTNSGSGPRTYDDRGAFEYQYEPAADSAPTAAVSVSPASGSAPLQVSADASASTDGDAWPIASYSFDWGDGSAVTGAQAGATAVHTYQSAGTYTLTVTVTDTGGLSSTATKTVAVTPPDAPPAAALSVSPESGTAPVQVSADASASTDPDSAPIATYAFDWGDGSAGTGPQGGATATHTYSTPGNYTVTVTVTDTAGLSSTATKAVTVTGDAAPTAAFSVSPTSGSAPLQVSADASASTDTDATPIATYSFDWGDGSAATGAQPGATAAHTYQDPGSYTVTVAVTDSGGLSSTATRTVTVAGDSPPDTVLSVSPESGTAPLQVSADASASTDTDGTPIATYSFDWGDASAGTGAQADPTATHTYPDAGTYKVNVTVTDTAGNSSTATGTVTVSANDSPPVAALTLSPTSGKIGVSVSADASASTDGDAFPIAHYGFTWGDGSGSTGPQALATASHTYSAAGTYTVTVTVTDTAGESSTATRVVTVTDDPPAATLAAIAVSPSQLAVTADASGSSDNDATGIATYAFRWGDGSASTGPQSGATATHVYTAAGTYTVTVTVTDTAGNASAATTQVTVRQNLAANFGFETNTTGWNTSGGDAGVTLARVAGGHSGGFAAQLANPNATAATTLLNDSPNWVTTSSTGPYVASMWVRADTAGATLTLRFREYTGSTLTGTGTSQVKLTNAWQQISLTYTPAAPGGSTLDLNAYVSKAAAGTGFYADDVAVYKP